MIAQSPAAATHKQSGSTSIAYGLKLLRRDAHTVALTSSDIDAVIGGATYRCYPGLKLSDIEFGGGLAVGNGEITTLNDGELFDEIEILNGLWDGATFELIQYDFFDPSSWTRIIIAGVMGEIRGIGSRKLTIEVRDMRQLLQTPIGFQTSKLCQKRLETCGYDLSGAGTFSGTVTHVTSRTSFRNSGHLQAADYFGAGDMTWLTGNNVGAVCMVLTHAADGSLTIPASLFADVQVGDTYTVRRGCRKTLAQCKIIRGNVYDFGGCPHKPNQDDFLKGGNSNAV